MLNDRFNIPAVSTKVSCRGDEDEILRLLPSGWAFLGMPKDEWCLDVFLAGNPADISYMYPKQTGWNLKPKKKETDCLKMLLGALKLETEKTKEFLPAFLLAGNWWRYQQFKAVVVHESAEKMLRGSRLKPPRVFPKPLTFPQTKNTIM